MDVYKLNTKIKMARKITKENFEEDTKKNKPYYLEKRKSQAAVCPACNNPIFIIGLYDREHPYGKHSIRTIPGIAEYNQNAYRYCPYANPNKRIEKNVRKAAFDPIARSILTILKEQFDRVIYIIRKETGIYLSSNIARHMLETYIGNEGYKYPYASLANIPWIFAYMTNSYSLWGQSVIPDSELRKALDKEPKVAFDGWRVISADEKFLYIHFTFLFHKIFSMDNIIKEKMTFFVHIKDGGKDKTVYEKEIIFAPETFSDLIQIPDDKGKRERELLEIAKEIIILPSYTDL